MESEYKYKAFISYRHLPADMAVAERLQKLLEQYRPPKNVPEIKETGISRIFRDSSELPTSGDLDDALKRALLASEFLIVILSPETKESKWCMREIREFKEAHGGKISHILPVLVSGEPADILPEELLFETVEEAEPSHVQTGTDQEAVEPEAEASGSKVPGIREVEPLCCDVRSDSIAGSLKLLKTEFLRIAAPLLGCGYDSLYRRHERRKRRLLAGFFTGLTAILSVIILVISLFAYRSYVAEKRYASNLEDTYIQQGSLRLLSGETQEALMYFGSALTISPDSNAAKTGALLLLQQLRWPYLQDKREGRLDDGSDPDYRYAQLKESELVICDQAGNSISSVPRPTEMNPGITPLSAGDFADEEPAVYFPGTDRAVVRYGEYLYDYDITQKEGRLLNRIDLALIFPRLMEQSGLLGSGACFAADNAPFIAVEEQSEVVILDLDTLKTEASHTNYDYGLKEVVFNNDASAYALIYGNNYGIDLYNPGGYAAVYDMQGKLLMQTEKSVKTTPAGACFNEKGDRLLIWGSGTLWFYDVLSGAALAEPLQCQSLRSAAFNGDEIVVDDGLGYLYECCFWSFPRKSVYRTETALLSGEADTSEPEEEWDNRERRFVLGEGLNLERDSRNLMLKNEAGEVISEIACPNNRIVDRMFVDTSSDTAYLWQRFATGIVRIPVDLKKKAFGEPYVIDTAGFDITDIRPFEKGFIVIGGNGYLMYYPYGEDDPEIMQPGENGIVEEVALNSAGLMAVIIKRTERPDAKDYQFDNYYTVELWQSEKGVKLADFEKGNTKKLENIRFTQDGYLSYEKRGSVFSWMIDAEAPDQQTVSFINSIPCMVLNEDQRAIVRQEFPGITLLGNWYKILDQELLNAGDLPVGEAPSAIITDTGSSEVEKKDDTLTEDEGLDAETVIQEGKDILAAEGKDAWILYYNGLWEDVENGRRVLKDKDLRLIFDDYNGTAQDLKLVEELKPGISCYIARLLSGDHFADLLSWNFENDMLSVMLQTKIYDELMAGYWDGSADQYLASLTESDADYDLKQLSSYENRVLACIMRGEGGEKAFEKATEELGDGVLRQDPVNGVMIYWELVKGNAEKAATLAEGYFKRLEDANRRMGYDNIYYEDVVFTEMVDLLESRGAVKTETTESFIRLLPYYFGIKLAKISTQSREAGLQAGDLIIAVDGHYFGNNFRLRRYLDEYPDASLTYIRDDKVYNTDVIRGWSIEGYLTVTEK